MKRKRIEDRALLDVVRVLPCIACARPGPTHPHHLRSRGAGGDDVFTNLISLCSIHHAEIHQEGLSAMAAIYPSVKYWLQGAGWEYDEARRSWYPPSEAGC